MKTNQFKTKIPKGWRRLRLGELIPNDFLYSARLDVNFSQGNSYDCGRRLSPFN